MGSTGYTIPNSTSDRIQDALYGFARSQMLFTALDLDLFSTIAHGGDRVELLADQLEVDPRALRIFLDGLVGIGFLNKLEGTYHLPEDVQKYLVQESPHYLGGMVTHCKALYENWMQLTDVVRSGQPAGGAQILADMEAYFSELVKGLYVSNYPTAKRLAQLLGSGQLGPAPQGLSVLDVAGGSAVWSIALLEADPSRMATVLDYPTVTTVAQEFVHKHGLTDRYSYLPGDLEEMEFPASQFDVAVLGNICHAIGPAAVQKLFHNVAKSLKPGGRVLIVDFVPDDQRSKPGWPLLFGVNMLVSTPDGNVFTGAQYREWLQEAGLTLTAQESLESEVTVLVGTKSV
jgi:ubiquinone/menaquinone biosynthesis C-methylase UbiE